MPGYYCHDQIQFLTMYHSLTLLIWHEIPSVDETALLNNKEIKPCVVMCKNCLGDLFPRCWQSCYYNKSFFISYSAHHVCGQLETLYLKLRGRALEMWKSHSNLLTSWRCSKKWLWRVFFPCLHLHIFALYRRLERIKLQLEIERIYLKTKFLWEFNNFVFCFNLNYLLSYSSYFHE